MPLLLPSLLANFSQSSAYAFGKFNAGGFAKSIAPPQPLKAVSKPPARAPDAVMSEKTTQEQAIIYRLSGDYNPLHIFPEIGQRLGFPGAILHGICSYGAFLLSLGMLARCFLASLADVVLLYSQDMLRARSSSRRLAETALVSPTCPRASLRASLLPLPIPMLLHRSLSIETLSNPLPPTRPVMPGDELETSMWFTEEKGGKRVDFVQKIKATGKVCLGGGVAFIKSQSGASKL